MQGCCLLSPADSFASEQATGERMMSFKRTLERSQRQVSELKQTIINLFQAVTAHRFRDVADDIRAVAIQGIAAWIQLLPATFLQDQYLKYLAWALSDKVRN